MLFLPCRPVPVDNSTVTGHATPTTLHHLTLDIRYLLLTRGIHLMELKYPYTRNMSTCWDHLEYNLSGSPEDSNLWETPINRGVPHFLRRLDGT
ncbi:hypothetical protein TIFTF001_005181 [Ficus carica]|uniref:Uncharacterized protein n=1 Tax=Ficus carica TaxID=3494 RepID=A0AA87ZN16_FICCA|nr:hypothetical protein TIFTF001_005181 [Ficus carica]